jgi:hypothetical protein
MQPAAGARPGPYRHERGGYIFELLPAAVTLLRRLPDFELKEEPAVAEDFLRHRAEPWAENLSDAGVAPGVVDVRIDVHARRARLHRGEKLLFTAEI